jgi:hydrogenase maturation factor
MTDRATLSTRDVVRCDDPNHCITCSDEGVPMRVVSYDASAGLAWCVDAADRRAEEGTTEDMTGGMTEVMTALVESVCVGDLLLVHAGTALMRLERDVP